MKFSKEKELALDHSYLLSILEYDPETGLFTRKVPTCNTVYAGDCAGTINHKYLIISINHKSYRAHRLAWFYINGEWPIDFIDHINGNRLDNRISNLRVVSKSQNAQNSLIRKDNSSGVKGVSWCKMMKKWFAYININKKRTKVGYFDNLSEAAKAVSEARESIHKEFCNHG